MHAPGSHQCQHHLQNVQHWLIPHDLFGNHDTGAHNNIGNPPVPRSVQTFSRAGWLRKQLWANVILYYLYSTRILSDLFILFMWIYQGTFLMIGSHEATYISVDNLIGPIDEVLGHRQAQWWPNSLTYAGPLVLTSGWCPRCLKASAFADLTHIVFRLDCIFMMT